ncbi:MULTISPECIES: hypothetical protein [unclassified Pseudoclavibacter]|uniref:hypothetical protein n=1 Tax=unclassified Pseudoclavibacter TaxID=2615177 RepID=UPI001BA7EF70|nr:hypothetical protein [Pseudoclavibacter sp. Marseille-Q4354]MBS3177767.1 hypothetical protein [Pseudoclavibacter sp. Marseille-Q4354]
MWDRDLPQEVDPLELYAGDHVVQEYLVDQLDEDGALIGPFNFSGWSISSQWRGNGREVDLDAVATEPGVLRLTLDKTATRAMRVEGRLDIQGIDVEGRVLTFVKCDVIVEADVTREA